MRGNKNTLKSRAPFHDSKYEIFGRFFLILIAGDEEYDFAVVNHPRDQGSSPLLNSDDLEISNDEVESSGRVLAPSERTASEIIASRLERGQNHRSYCDPKHTTQTSTLRAPAVGDEQGRCVNRIFSQSKGSSRLDFAASGRA